MSAVQCLGDQSAALVGQDCLDAGMTKNTYGTGCFLLCNTGPAPSPSHHGLVTTVGYQLGPHEAVYYALEGSIAVAGKVVRWLRDELGIIQEDKEVGEWGWGEGKRREEVSGREREMELRVGMVGVVATVWLSFAYWHITCLMGFHPSCSGMCVGIGRRDILA